MSRLFNTWSVPTPSFTVIRRTTAIDIGTGISNDEPTIHEMSKSSHPHNQIVFNRGAL